MVQWLIFLRLTFWELSWDVMEPVTYFTSSLFGICTYTYFIGTNREFGYKDATSHLRSRWEVTMLYSCRSDIHIQIMLCAGDALSLASRSHPEELSG